MQSITFRPLTHITDFAAMEAIEQAVWGSPDPTPAHQSYITTHTGGVAIGAFDGDRMIGFCYSFAAWDGGEPWLHSHLLAVMPNYRRLGLGEQLKWLQREAALAKGYRRMTWTYAPLEAANAYLNLAKLGAAVRVYKPDYYGEMTDQLNRGIPSDRMWVEWDLASPRVAALAAGAPGAAPATGAPGAAPAGRPGGPGEVGAAALPAVLPFTPGQAADRGAPWPAPGEPDLEPAGRPAVTLAIPWSFQQLRTEHRPLALAWHRAVAAALRRYLGAGYAAVNFLPPAPGRRGPGGTGHYVLAKER